MGSGLDFGYCSHLGRWCLEHETWTRKKVCARNRSRPFSQGYAVAYQHEALRFRHRLAQANDLVTCLELTTLGEQFNAFEALEDVAFCGNGTGPFEAAVLGHKINLVSPTC